MKNVKFNLDRPQLNSEQVTAHENYASVVENAATNPTSMWKNPWFYGPIGLSSIALVITLSLSAFINSPPGEPNKQLLAAALPEDTPCVLKPTNLDVPYDAQKFDVRQDFQINLNSGTSIQIPAKTFESSDNTATLKTREFHDKTSAFISGVKMDCENSAFESAGMIEIIVEDADGKELAFQNNQEMKVTLVLDQKDKDFKFWYLNKEKANWEEYPSVFSDLKNEVNVLESPKNIERRILLAEKEIKICDQQLATMIAPAPKEFNLPTTGVQKFDLDFDVKAYPELSKLKDVEFEVAETGNYDKSFTKKSWSAVELKKSGKNDYLAIFSNSNEKFSIKVNPVLKGNEAKNAKIKFDETFDNYQTQKNEITVKRNSLEKELGSLKANIDNKIRALDVENQQNEMMKNQTSGIVQFNVSAFGYFNCDKKVNYPPPFTREMPLVWEGGDAIQSDIVYVFDKHKNLRFNYGISRERRIEDLGFRNKSENYVLVIDHLRNIGIAVFNQDDEFDKLIFKKIDQKKITSVQLASFLNGEELPA